jgi:hypothetical protein
MRKSILPNEAYQGNSGHFCLPLTNTDANMAGLCGAFLRKQCKGIPWREAGQACHLGVLPGSQIKR